MVMFSLILQRTSNKCKTSETKSHVKRRLSLRKNKDVEGLLNETRTIQKRLPKRQKSQTVEEKAKLFARVVLEGKVNAAIRLLEDDTMMLHGSFNHVNDIIFDGVNTDLVRKCVMRLELKVQMDLQDWMRISVVKS